MTTHLIHITLKLNDREHHDILVASPQGHMANMELWLDAAPKRVSAHILMETLEIQNPKYSPYCMHKLLHDYVQSIVRGASTLGPSVIDKTEFFSCKKYQVQWPSLSLTKAMSNPRSEKAKIPKEMTPISEHVSKASGCWALGIVWTGRASARQRKQ